MQGLSIQDLNVWYGAQQALKTVSLELPARQITAIIGPSGCGKTTLLKTLNRLLDLNEDVLVEGQVIVDGENIYAPGVAYLERKIG
jgi:phosphate transport system ATP-binding protein